MRREYLSFNCISVVLFFFSAIALASGPPVAKDKQSTSNNNSAPASPLHHSPQLSNTESNNEYDLFRDTTPTTTTTTTTTTANWNANSAKDAAHGSGTEPSGSPKALPNNGRSFGLYYHKPPASVDVATPVDAPEFNSTPPAQDEEGDYGIGILPTAEHGNAAMRLTNPIAHAMNFEYALDSLQAFAHEVDQVKNNDSDWTSQRAEIFRSNGIYLIPTKFSKKNLRRLNRAIRILKDKDAGKTLNKDDRQFIVKYEERFVENNINEFYKLAEELDKRDHAMQSDHHQQHRKEHER